MPYASPAGRLERMIVALLMLAVTFLLGVFFGQCFW